MKNSIVLLLFLFLVACSSAESLPPEVTPEPASAPAASVPSSSVPLGVAAGKEEIEEIEEIEKESELESELAGWFAAWAPMIPDFSMADVEEVKNGLIKRDVFDAVSQEQLNAIMELEVELNMPLLFPSPDENWVLFVSADIEPDSEVALISMAEGIYERLLHCGTPCAWDGAGWLDNERFIVTGYVESDDSESISPTLHVFNMGNDTVIEYRGPAVDADTFFGQPVTSNQ